MPSVLASVFGAKVDRTPEKDLAPDPDGFHRTSPELEAVIEAAVRPSPQRMNELLSRQPGQLGTNPTPEKINAFFEKMKALYPDQYRDEPAAAPIATREQVLAAIAEKMAATPQPAPSTSTTTKVHPMEKHFLDEYAQHFKAMRREPNMEGIAGYASEYANSQELQAEFKNVGGFVAFTAYRRATDQGRVKVFGPGRNR